MDDTMPDNPSKPDGPRKTAKIKKSFVGRAFSTARLSGRLGIGAARKLLNTGDMDPEKAVKIATKLVNEFDGMKGLMMKFGQMASYLGTHMPPEARELLAQLQSNSTAMEFSLVRHIVEQELQAPIEECFDDFQEEAFAAASIGQVHKATVNGRPVAVKVQYPDIDRLLAMDLKLVGNLFTLFMMGTNMPGKAMAEELRDRILEECDYENEAHNQLTIRNLCENTSEEHIPDVLLSHSSRRVLTTELVQATDFQTFCRTADQETRNRAGLIIFRHTMNAIFRHCYFNGDPHPGNYLFHADGRVTFLDFGCIKKFELSYIERWKQMARSVIEQDKAANYEATDAMGLIGNKKSFDHDFHWDMINHVYTPFKTDGIFCYSHEHNAETNKLMLWDNKNKFSAAMPSDFLFINRLQWGLAAVLADLNACNRYGPVFREAVYSEAVPLFKN
ncbi:MAG: AarF/ABC1/UbiB kinase family protein [Ketobacteraceae bacterium]|nr:AarF/ABC1/UbiB kinase family protein [Ketobacteraceae bacterium]